MQAQAILERPQDLPKDSRMQDADWVVQDEADVAKALEAILAYHQRKIESVGDVPTAPLQLPHSSTTAVMMLVTRLLKSANVEIFELGMWQSFSGYRPE
jgi:hypothetical protein